MNKENKRKTGAWYEQKAAEYLKKQGHRIIERNHRNKFGELDILSEKEGILIICEVKFRSGNFCGDPLEAVDMRKQKRICRTTLHYYRMQGFEMDIPCRFDVVAFYGDGTMKHIIDAFPYQA